MVFDPTAFENMKVVAEGAVYDLDFEGKAIVTGRQDLINLAEMSRIFAITFESRTAAGGRKISGTVKMEAGLDNLASELLKDGNPIKAGVRMFVLIDISGYVTEKGREVLYDTAEEIWGRDRDISVVRTEAQDGKNGEAVHAAQCRISFGRLIGEDQIDDLPMMAGYLLNTLDQISLRL